MRRLITLFFWAFIIGGTVMAQQMSDDQVIQYIQNAQKAGKAEKQIVSELMRRGITKEQVERIRENYEIEQQSGNVSDEGKLDNRSRQRVQKAYIDNTQPKLSVANQLMAETNSSAIYYNEMQPTVEVAEEPTEQIFGHNIFTNPNLTFEPSMNIATPLNYCLGPGDEVIIDVWGASETSIRQTISPEGSILISNLGPVYLSGKTVEEANEYLKQEFARIYSGVSGNQPSTQVKLALGEEASKTIGNIDRLEPKMFTPSATNTTNSITLTGSTEDAEKTETDGCSGIDIYYFSIDGGVTWEPDNGQVGTSYTFSGLVQGKEYELKMKAVDKAGNETETEEAVNNPVMVYFADGSTMTTFLGDCFDIVYDVNGEKSPNESGRDQYRYTFCFAASPGMQNTQGFRPYLSGRATSREDAYNRCIQAAAFCSTLLQYDGWEYKDDYPYKL